MLRESGKYSFAVDLLARAKTALCFIELVKKAIDCNAGHVGPESKRFNQPAKQAAISVKVRLILCRPSGAGSLSGSSNPQLALWATDMVACFAGWLGSAGAAHAKHFFTDAF